MAPTSENSQLVVAAVQMVSSPALQENIETAKTLIHQAAQKGAQVIALPEYFCLMGLKDTDKVKAREKIGSGPIQEQLAQMAQKNGVYLFAGTIPLETDDPNKVLNTTLIFNPQGSMVGRYDKIHLFGFKTDRENYQEAETIEAGDQPKSITLLINGVEWRFGLSICYDLRFPELYRIIGEVDCHIIPAAFTYTTGKDHWEILLKARAIENQCYVLASAQGGQHINKRRTWGNSMLVDPWGQILQKIPEGLGVFTGILYKERLKTIRSQLPALQHRKL